LIDRSPGTRTDEIVSPAK